MGAAPAAGQDRTPAFDWRWFGVAAFVSTITMPISAILFLGIGGLVVGFASVGAAMRRATTLSRAHSVGFGLLVGPAIYLTLAVVT